MTIRELDVWFRKNLDIEGFAGKDDSLNGIQVGRGEGSVASVAFAVDACAESISRAAAAGAQVLFVHHGLFWGKSERIEGPMLGRIRTLVQADMALYACHLPLDCHQELGNNAVLARLLGLEKIEAFGRYHGMDMGFAGILAEAIGLEEAIRRILPDGSRPRTVIAAGKPNIRKVAVVSGGAPFEALQALGTDIDLYITGEPSHSIYHHVVEGGLNFVAAGHYATEVWGVRAVAERLAAETGIATTFIDLPTGL